jgi:hypothetical protein
MTALITQADVERRIGARTLAQLLDDDGDEVADAANVTWMLNTASRIAEGALKPGFPTAALVATLVAADAAVLNDVVEIAAGLAGGHKPGLVGADGRSPYDGWRDKAEKRLVALGKAESRATGEETAGNNRKLATSKSCGRELLFSSTPSNPTGSGGF